MANILTEAVILAGGLGTRLKSRVTDLPKTMASVAGRPFLEILLSSLAQKGFRRVVLSVGYKAEKITEHFGNSFSGLELIYEIESTPLGTGGALRRALKRCDSDPVLVLNGDTYLEFSLPELEEHWKKHGLPVILARQVADTSSFGRLETENHRVVTFCEKGPSGPGLINGGCYVLPRHFLDTMPMDKPFSLEVDFLTQAVQTQKIAAVVTSGLSIDIGVPEDLDRAQTELGKVLSW